MQRETDTATASIELTLCLNVFLQASILVSYDNIKILGRLAQW